MTPEQFSAANKANLDALVDLTRKSFEGIEKLVALNLQATRVAMGESAQQAKAWLSVKDPQELMHLQAGLIQPVSDHANAYSRQVCDIANNTQAEVTRLVEAQMALAQEKILALVDTALKNAPIGSESAAALVKQTVTAANSALENVQKAAKQAVGATEANFQALSQAGQHAGHLSENKSELGDAPHAPTQAEQAAAPAAAAPAEPAKSRKASAHRARKA